MIRILIIDDSALIRQLLSEILSSDPRIEVVGTAQGPFVAAEKIKILKPDVLILDMEIPKMDGLSFLRRLLRKRPLPVVMLSSMTDAAAEITLQALELGAVDYIFKPGPDRQQALRDGADEIITKVKSAALARVQGPNLQLAKSVEITETGARKPIKTADMLIAIGASTGGTEALKDVLGQLPSTTPGTVITQHIPAAFSKAFADRLNAHSAMTVTQAEHGQQILPGHAYLAPGDKHLVVARDGQDLVCQLLDSEPVNRHKPSVEVMFRSVIDTVAADAIAVLLTGMGNDGSEALGEIQHSGAVTIAQDEASSVVWGMPGEAVKRGYADEVLPLNKIAERVLYYVSRHG